MAFINIIYDVLIESSRRFGSLRRSAYACQVAGGEGRLEVVAATGSCQVQYLAGEIQTGMEAALHCFGIDLFERDSADRDHCLVP